MSGTEDFGTGGYGAGDAERAAAEPGPGGSTRNAPPTGPRVHVPNQNPGPNQGAAAAGAPNGTPNGAPWLAAGSVPYAEAMFGAGQDGQQHQQHPQPQGPTNALRAAAGVPPPRAYRAALERAQARGGAVSLKCLGKCRPPAPATPARTHPNTAPTDTPTAPTATRRTPARRSRHPRNRKCRNCRSRGTTRRRSTPDSPSRPASRSRRKHRPSSRAAPARRIRAAAPTATASATTGGPLVRVRTRGRV